MRAHPEMRLRRNVSRNRPRHGHPLRLNAGQTLRLSEKSPSRHSLAARRLLLLFRSRGMIRLRPVSRHRGLPLRPNGLLLDRKLRDQHLPRGGRPHLHSVPSLNRSRQAETPRGGPHPNQRIADLLRLFSRTPFRESGLGFRGLHAFRHFWSYSTTLADVPGSPANFALARTDQK